MSPGSEYPQSADAATPEWTSGYSESSNTAFGDALVRLLNENRKKNVYLAALERLEALNLPAADTTAVVALDEAEGGEESVPYRHSGRPEPGTPGFDAWLSDEGTTLGATLVVVPRWVVARCRDGVRRAFPIGALGAHRENEGLVFVAAPDATWRVAETDARIAEALCEWLRRRRVLTA